MKNNLEFLQNELIRTSEWLKFAEQKFTLLSLYYALGITYITQNVKDINKIFIENNLSKFIIFIVFIITLILGIYFLFKVIFPNLKNVSTSKSFFFYSHISNMKILDYIKEFKDLSNEELEKQILEQIHTNSEITNQKMLNIISSFRFLFINLIFLIALIFII
ncbi:MAG: DUF5706 domain-containing protein [Candidatus Gracilibacteria bacterium]|nr:DUF5706 domain-containing protein [Candidatus Gracilibacteria bacterium]